MNYILNRVDDEQTPILVVLLLLYCLDVFLADLLMTENKKSETVFKLLRIFHLSMKSGINYTLEAQQKVEFLLDRFDLM